MKKWNFSTMAINLLIFSGNLGRDAQTAYTNTGKAVTKFSVPCVQGYGDNKKTAWVECVAWGERFEKISSYLPKGAMVTVTGALYMDKYTDKEGNERQTLCCNVSDIQLPSLPKGHNPNPVPNSNPVPNPNSSSTPTYNEPPMDFDDDLPF